LNSKENGVGVAVRIPALSERFATRNLHVRQFFLEHRQYFCSWRFVDDGIGFPMRHKADR